MKRLLAYLEVPELVLPGLVVPVVPVVPPVEPDVPLVLEPMPVLAPEPVEPEAAPPTLLPELLEPEALSASQRVFSAPVSRSQFCSLVLPVVEDGEVVLELELEDGVAVEPEALPLP